MSTDNGTGDLHEIRMCLECLKNDVEAVREMDKEIRSYVKGAMDSFNNDLVQTFKAQERRLGRIERVLWGEKGTNGLMGQMVLIAERQDTANNLTKWIAKGVIAVLLTVIGFFAVEVVVPAFKNSTIVIEPGLFRYGE